MKIELKRNEEILRARTETELFCDIIPVALWVLILTNLGRQFTCKISSGNNSNKNGESWENVEFDEVKEGRHYPF